MWTGILLTCLGVCLAGPAADKSAVHFPDAAEEMAEQVRDKKDVLSRQMEAPFIPEPCPDNQDFCEHIQDYPSHLEVSPAASVNEFVRDKIFDKPKPPQAPALTRRFGDNSNLFDFEEESQACRHRRSVVYPKKAKNTLGKFMFIVNKEEYKQSVDIEQCEGEGQPCETDGDAPQMNVGSTVCRQKFTTFKLYAINHEGEQVYDSFSLPSACLCYHKSKFSVRGGFSEPNDHSRSRSNLHNELPFCPSEEQMEPFDNFVGVAKVPKAKNPTSRLTFGHRQERNNNRRTRQQQKFPSFKPKACKKGMFCEKDRNYPFNAIASVLKQDRQLSGKLFEEVFNSECQSPQNQINTRFLPTEESLCDGRPRVIYPKKALNLKNEWMFVVNLANYTQSVEIEECIDQSNRRQFGAVGVETKFGVCLYGGAEGHNPDLTVCKQKYTEHKLLAFTADSELLVDSFKLPSACACYVKSDFTFDFEIRHDFQPQTSKPAFNFG